MARQALQCCLAPRCHGYQQRQEGIQAAQRGASHVADVPRVALHLVNVRLFSTEGAAGALIASATSASNGRRLQYPPQEGDVRQRSKHNRSAFAVFQSFFLFAPAFHIRIRYPTAILST